MKRTRQEWERLVDELAESGLGTTEFARRKGIHPPTMTWWRWRIGADRRAAAPRAPAFVPVVIRDVAAVAQSVPQDELWEDVEVGLPNGVFLRLRGVTSTGLREVVDIVGAR